MDSEDGNDLVVEGREDSLLPHCCLLLSRNARVLCGMVGVGVLALGALRDVVGVVVGACGDGHCHPWMDFFRGVDPGDGSLEKLSHTPANYFLLPLLPFPSSLPPSCYE